MPWCARVDAGGVVYSCNELALRSALITGGTVTFACDGVINLSNPLPIPSKTILDATGHQITLNGANAVRVFYVATNVAFTLVHLTVANGYSTNGAGLYNAGGTVTLLADTFETNVVCWDGTSAAPVGGAAIFNQSGTVWATNCSFLANHAGVLLTNLPHPPIIAGGAVRNEGGLLTFENCLFAANQAVGANETTNVYAGTDALGGAIFNDLGSNVVDHCDFSQNSVTGGSRGGAGRGGAICSYGTLIAACSAFASNTAAGGSGASSPMADGSPGGAGGAADGAAICNAGTLWLQAGTVSANLATGGYGGAGADGSSSYIIMYGGYMGQPGGPAGMGGSASGGIYNSGTASLVNDTIASNTATGGRGGNGGNGGYSTVTDWIARGGNGGNGGAAAGGLADVSGVLRLTNCTVAGDSAAAGSGGPGGLGNTAGMPIGPGGASGTDGTPVAGGLASPACTFANTLLAWCAPSNFTGTNVDAQGNLSSDGSCAFSAGSFNNINPQLGPLADNGGPTPTMALLLGSPAIDAGFSAGAPVIDQRGIARPQGSAVDIGAFEYQWIPAFTGMNLQGGTNLCLQITGLLPNQTFLLQASSNLLNWSSVTNFSTTNGMFQCLDPFQGAQRARFYRVAQAARF